MTTQKQTQLAGLSLHSDGASEARNSGARNVPQWYSSFLAGLRAWAQPAVQEKRQQFTIGGSYDLA